MNGNPEVLSDAWLLAIWRGLTTEPVWKYQELPPFLLPELIKLDLVEASDSELSRVIWFCCAGPGWLQVQGAPAAVASAERFCGGRVHAAVVGPILDS